MAKKRTEITDSLKKKVIKLYLILTSNKYANASQKRIAEDCNTNQPTVSRIITEYYKLKKW